MQDDYHISNVSREYCIDFSFFFFFLYFFHSHARCRLSVCDLLSTYPHVSSRVSRTTATEMNYSIELQTMDIRTNIDRKWIPLAIVISEIYVNAIRWQISWLSLWFETGNWWSDARITASSLEKSSLFHCPSITFGGHNYPCCGWLRRLDWLN